MVCIAALFLTFSFLLVGSIGDKLNQSSSVTDPSTQPSTNEAVVTPAILGSAILPQSYGRVQIVTAVVETTPSICPTFVYCGFQVYNKVTHVPSEPYIQFCKCPDGEECLYHSQRLGQHYYAYKCSKIAVTQAATTKEATTESATTESGTESIRRTGTLNDKEIEPVRNQKPINIPKVGRIGLSFSSEEL